jgi:hypothetical protein
MLGELVFIIIVDSWNFLSYPNSNGGCSTVPIINQLSSIISALMRVYVPFLIMIALNWLVILNLKKSKKTANLSQFVNREQVKAAKAKNKKDKFTINSIIMDCIFMSFYVPYAIGVTLQTSGYIGSNHPVNVAVFTIYYTIVNLLAFSYDGWLIVIFCSFNRLFRNEFIKIFRLKRVFPMPMTKTVTKTMEASVSNNLATKNINFREKKFSKI